MIIYIEGNIGSGKSTFLKTLSSCLDNSKNNISFITEPVDEWIVQIDEHGKNILNHFYEDQTRWAFTFQMNSFISRIRRMEQQKNEINIIERSVFTDRYCFAKNCYESGKMNKMEYDIYCKWNDWLIETFNVKPCGYIYLRTSPEVCSDRINARSRNEEGGIPIDYLEKLHNSHDDWLNNATTPVLEIDITKNYLEDSREKETLVSRVESFILSLTDN